MLDSVMEVTSSRSQDRINDELGCHNTFPFLSFLSSRSVDLYRKLERFRDMSNHILLSSLSNRFSVKGEIMFVQHTGNLVDDEDSSRIFIVEELTYSFNSVFLSYRKRTPVSSTVPNLILVP